MSGNKNNYLITARRDKKDEFYTQYDDISAEVDKFSTYFSGKVVYCPADHHTKSNFPKYFIDNFDRLNLKGLYISDIDDGAYYYDGKTEERIGGPVDIRGDRFIDYLNKCDIVVTNPPFSLFVKFLHRILEAEKDFLIIGQQNAITTRYTFSYILENRVYVDFSFKGLAAWFDVPDYYEDVAASGEHKEGKIRVSGVVWFTSFNILNDVDELELKCSCKDELGNHDHKRYPFFDNFREISGKREDCICVNKTTEIPKDWNGYIGVPITFLGKYNPNQFEIIQLDHYGPLGNQDNKIEGKQKYRRIYIKKRERE